MPKYPRRNSRAEKNSEAQSCTSHPSPRLQMFTPPAQADELLLPTVEEESEVVVEQLTSANPTVLQRVLGHYKDDSFTQTLRKLSALLNLIVAPFAVAYGAYWIWAGVTESEGSGAGSVMMGVLCIILMFIIVTNFVLVRKWQEVSDLHTTIFLWGMLVPCWCTVICTPEFGSRMLLIWYSMMAVTNQSDHAPIQCTIALVGQILSCYNNAYSTARGGTPWEVPGARLYGPNIEVFGELAGATVVSNSVVIAVYLQGRVYSQTYKEAQQGKAARAAVALTTKVVDLLRKYDTDGVGETLDRYSGGDSAVDPDLLRSFRKMKANLETYRPHLPTYVFQEDEEDSAAVDDDEGEVAGRSMLSMLDASLSHDGEMDSRSPTIAGLSNTSFVERHPSGTTTPVASQSTATAGARGSNQYLSSPAAAVGLLPRRRSSMNSAVGGSGQNITRKISIALLDCHRVTKVGSSETDLQNFVNSIYQRAADTRGSIHSIVGDVVQVTWNTMARVMGPESKAARFLVKVHKDAQASKYTVAGVACSGLSRCHSALSKTKQQCHLVHFEWDGGLAACFSLAKKYRVFLVDHSTQCNAMHDVEFRAVDQLSYSYPIDDEDDPTSFGEMLLDQQVAVCEQRRCSAIGSFVGAMQSGGLKDYDLIKDIGRPAIKKSIIYEVLKEVKHGGEGEWMYQLNKQGAGNQGRRGSNEVIKTALEAILRGDYGDALSSLNDLERGELPSDLQSFRAPLVQRLVNHCEQQLSQFTSARR